MNYLIELREMLSTVKQNLTLICEKNGALDPVIFSGFLSSQAVFQYEN